MNINKSVIIFGVFDKLHEGHRFLIDEAKKLGDVTAIVARDSSVLKLKNKIPKENEIDRVENLKDLVSNVVLGDEEEGEYKVLKNIILENNNENKENNNAIICFGYDQKELKKDIEERIEKGELLQIELIVLPSFKPEIFHSSLLN